MAAQTIQGCVTGISWLLTPEPETLQEPLLHLSTDCIMATHKHLGSDGILAAMKKSLEQLIAAQTATVGQKANHLWHALRKGRLTASHFGSVLMTKHVTPSLISRLCGSQELDSTVDSTVGYS